jgi:hypothetical protein
VQPDIQGRVDLAKQRREIERNRADLSSKARDERRVTTRALRTDVTARWRERITIADHQQAARRSAKPGRGNPGLRLAAVADARTPRTATTKSMTARISNAARASRRTP